MTIGEPTMEIGADLRGHLGSVHHRDCGGAAVTEIPYVLDPDDRTSMRCYDNRDGIPCMRRWGHPESTTVKKKVTKPDGEEAVIEVTFNHRGGRAGRWYTW